MATLEEINRKVEDLARQLAGLQQTILRNGDGRQPGVPVHTLPDVLVRELTRNGIAVFDAYGRPITGPQLWQNVSAASNVRPEDRIRLKRTIERHESGLDRR